MTWQIEDLRQEILRTLAEGSFGDGRIIEGRAIAVKASPQLNNSQNFAIGLSAIPPGFSTTPHEHDAEELAIAISGSGSVEIGDSTHRLTEGTLLVTPPGARHTTRADEAEPLVILWFYSPPGSETRWFAPSMDE